MEGRWRFHDLKKKNGEEMRIFSLEKIADGRRLCRGGTKFFVPEMAKDTKFITITLLKKLKIKFQKF